MPISTARSAAAKRSSASRSAPGRAAVSASSRIRSSSGTLPLELALEPLRAGADARELGRAAGRARLGYRLAMTAVVAVEAPVRVQRERDVADAQRRETPHARQWSAGATPRRLRSRIALPPRSAIRPSSASSGAESG